MVLRRNKDLSERMKGNRNEFEGQKIKHNGGGVCNPVLARISQAATFPSQIACATACYYRRSAALPRKLGRHVAC